MVKNVVILGACPSKDPFYRQSADMQFKILADIRTSIFTFDLKPLPITENCDEFIPANVVTNSNNRYLLYSDFTKNTLTTLFSLENVDVIVVDVTPERFNHAIVEYDNNQYDLLCNIGFNNLLTYLNDNSKNKPINIIKQYSLSDIPKEIIVEKYRQFFKLVHDKFPNAKIILNEVFYANKLLTSENKIIEYSKNFNIDLSNKTLKHCYSAMYEALAEYNIDEIKFPRNTLGSESHIWGIHPLHFTKEYYLYVIEALANICKMRRTNSITNLLSETELKYKQIIDSIQLTEKTQILQQQFEEILEKLDCLLKKK